MAMPVVLGAPVNNKSNWRGVWVVSEAYAGAAVQKSHSFCRARICTAVEGLGRLPANPQSGRQSWPGKVPCAILSVVVYCCCSIRPAGSMWYDAVANTRPEDRDWLPGNSNFTEVNECSGPSTSAVCGRCSLSLFLHVTWLVSGVPE